MLFANCHFHSTFSDGEYHPNKLVELAKSLGHRALILTDHDTVRGTYFLQNAARKAGMLSLLGCEFSTKGLGSSFHLVGIDFNPENVAMRKLLALLLLMCLIGLTLGAAAGKESNQRRLLIFTCDFL